MAEADITFLIFVGLGAVIFTVLVLIWKGLVWMSLICAAFWFILGFYFAQRTQEGTVLLQYQEYIQLLMLAIGFAMIFSPFWLKQKDMDLEQTPDDINIFGDGKEMGEFEESKRANRERIEGMKAQRNSRRRGY
jgi:hypothetical protein